MTSRTANTGALALRNVSGMLRPFHTPMDSPAPNLDALRIDRSRASTTSGGRGGLWLLLLLLAAGGGAGWWYLRQQPVVVKTAVVKPSARTGGAGQTLLNASGYVTTRLDATVSSKVTGKVVEILVEEGMKVDKGQVLARLDDVNVRAGLRVAQAQLDAMRMGLAETEPMLAFANAEAKRLADLESSGAQTRAERDRAEAEARSLSAKLERQKSEILVAERQVEEWQQQIEDTIIRAPFAGVVTTKDAQPGEMISPMSSGGFTRTGICTLVDMGSLEVEVDVGESFINRVTAGQEVVATLDAYPDWKIPGKVAAIIPTADRQKATVKVRVAFNELDPRMLPQMGVKVAFQGPAVETPVAAAPGVLAPASALVRTDGRDIAWVVREGRVERRAVSVGDLRTDEVLVTAGLASGETVVLNPPPTLSDGQAVKVETPR